MEKDWVKLVTIGNRQKAQIILTALESKGIKAVLIDKKDSSYTSFGEVELYCHADDALEALKIVEYNFPI
jgi:hypothetical protein